MCHYAEYCYAEGYLAEYHYAEYHYTECHGLKKCSQTFCFIVSIAVWCWMSLAECHHD
jgi:hypothetical protein